VTSEPETSTVTLNGTGSGDAVVVHLAFTHIPSVRNAFEPAPNHRFAMVEHSLNGVLALTGYLIKQEVRNHAPAGDRAREPFAGIVGSGRLPHCAITSLLPGAEGLPLRIRSGAH
jgi:hypothetical protein